MHSYSICWLRLAATLFTHTLSHAWCPVTLLSLTCCPTVVVTVVAASCGRARDSMGSMGSIGAVARCVVAARLPPSAISVTVQHRITVQCSAMQCNAVQCSALYSTAVHCTGAFNRWFLCRSLVLLESFWSPSSVVVVRRVVIAASRVFRHEGCIRMYRDWILRLRRQFPWLL